MTVVGNHEMITLQVSYLKPSSLNANHLEYDNFADALSLNIPR